MKKTIVDGWIGRGIYLPEIFSSFMKGLGAERVPVYTMVYHFQDVTVVYLYRNSRQFGGIYEVDSRIDLVGDENKVGVVERILLAEQEKFNPSQTIHLGMQG